MRTAEGVIKPEVPCWSLTNGQGLLIVFVEVIRKEPNVNMSLESPAFPNGLILDFQMALDPPTYFSWGNIGNIAI